MSTCMFVTDQTHNNLPIVQIHHPSGSQLLVYLFGAHIFSWNLGDQREVLFMSDSAIFDNATPIRGGIPLVFPQFGGGDLPSHGFARRSVWSIHSMEVDTLVLKLTDNESTRNMWNNNKFTLLYSIKLEADSITTSLCVENQGDKPFNFQALLHTYFLLRNIKHTTLNGLSGKMFTDKLKDNLQPFVQPEGQPVVFDREIDRIFIDAPSTVTLEGLALSNINHGENNNASTTCYALNGKDGSVTIDINVDGGSGHDIVVWNPWIDKSKRMTDFSDDEYHNMCCVEPGYVSKWEILEPNTSWTISQKLVINDVGKSDGTGGSSGSGETKL